MESPAPPASPASPVKSGRWGLQVRPGSMGIRGSRGSKDRSARWVLLDPPVIALGATLRRTADAVEADFGFNSAGYLNRDDVLAWAGASAVTVARLWGNTGAAQLGAELVTNGTFDANITGWTPYRAASLSHVDGKMRVEATTTSYAFASAPISGLTVGATYLLKASSEGDANRYIQVSTIAGDGGTGLIPTVTGVASRHITFVATQTTHHVKIFAGFASTAKSNWDNISVREVLTTNAIQSTASAMPPLDLSANPLTIGASAEKSLVATIPTTITNAKVIRALNGAVAVTTETVSAGAFTVQNATAYSELAVLAADTPDADVAKVAAAMRRAWSLDAGAMPAITAIGAEHTTIDVGGVDYEVLQFKIVGSTDLVISGGALYGAEYLIVAGGGTGGSSTSRRNGGGGAGGVVARVGAAIAAGTYPVAVGAGGIVGARAGQNSSALGITALGGGQGGGVNTNGSAGGSGGGAGGQNGGGSAAAQQRNQDQHPGATERPEEERHSRAKAQARAAAVRAQRQS
jgi:hypothetical protein